LFWNLQPHKSLDLDLVLFRYEIDGNGIQKFSPMCHLPEEKKKLVCSRVCYDNVTPHPCGITQNQTIKEDQLEEVDAEDFQVDDYGE